MSDVNLRTFPKHSGRCQRVNDLGCPLPRPFTRRRGRVRGNGVMRHVRMSASDQKERPVRLVGILVAATYIYIYAAT